MKPEMNHPNVFAEPPVSHSTDCQPCYSGILRPLAKSVKLKNDFISKQKHMLWILQKEKNQNLY